MTLQKFIDTTGMVLAILTISVDALHTLICGVLASVHIFLIIIWALFDKEVQFYMLKQTYVYRHSFGIKDLNEFFFLATKVANRIYY